MTTIERLLSRMTTVELAPLTEIRWRKWQGLRNYEKKMTKKMIR